MAADPSRPDHYGPPPDYDTTLLNGHVRTAGRWPLRYVGVAAVGVVLLAVALGIGLFGGGGARPAGLGGSAGTTGAGSSGPGTPGATSAAATGTPTAGAQASATPSPTKAKTTTKPPPPSSGGRPGPGNTGVPAGTRLRVLQGDQEFSVDNQVISGIDAHGIVRITGRNITIKNSIFRGGGPPCSRNAAVLETEDGFGATIMDSEINPTNPHACLDGIWAENATLLRLNIHGAVDGVKAFDNVVLQDSWIHDLGWFASDPNQGGGATHNDCVQTYEGSKNILIRHNTMDAGPKGNATYQVTQDFGKVATNLRIENNFLDGGACILNFAHKGGPTPMTGIYVVNNRFGRHSFYQCPILVSTQTQLSQNSGNVWDDTGKPIPPPERHD